MVEASVTPLCELAAKFGTDKYRPHNYTPVYWRLLGDRADRVEKVLEVGIGKGRSLRMWEAFFPKARVVGIDIKPELLVNQGRITSYLGDQGKPGELAEIAASFGGSFDLIIDDGAHDPEHQIIVMEALLPFLVDDGVYAIEDVRYLTDAIVKKIPVGYRHESYEGEKRLVAGLRKGRGEVLMVIQHCSG